MAKLLFPEGTYTLHLKPASVDSGVRGTITLLTVGQDHWVEVDLGLRGKGAAKVTYVSTDDGCGKISPFTLVVAGFGGAGETWDFDWLFASEPEFLSDGVYLVAANVEVGGRNCSLTGLPERGKRPPLIQMDVILKAGGPAGSLIVEEDGAGERSVKFVSLSTQVGVAVHLSNERITWIYDRVIYSGYRFASLGAAGADCSGAAHGYTGRANGKVKSEDEWEATAAIPPVLPGEAGAAGSSRSMAFPAGRYRMIVTTPRNTALGMAGMTALNGVCELSGDASACTVTIESGPNPPVLVQAYYSSSQPRYGTITLNPFAIGGETWAIAAITVFRDGNETHLFANNAQIDNHSAWISGFPLTFVPHPGLRLRIKQPTAPPGTDALGVLTNRDLVDGEFESPNGAVVPFQNLRWDYDGNHHYGFPAIVALTFSGGAAHPEFGYRGYRTPLEFGTLSQDDWEATASVPPPPPNEEV